jgi:hypothetical protein
MHRLVGLCQAYLSFFYLSFNLFLDDTQATLKGTILSAHSEKYQGTSS